MKDITDLKGESDGEHMDGDCIGDADIEDLSKMISELNENVRELRLSVELCSDKITGFKKKLSKLDDTIKLRNQLERESESMKRLFPNWMTPKIQHIMSESNLKMIKNSLPNKNQSIWNI